MQIYQRIRALRKAKGVLAKDVAQEIGVSASAYALLETGQRRMRAEHVEKISKALHVSIAELYGETPTQVRKDVKRGKGKHLRLINTPELRERLRPILGDQTDEAVQCFELWIRAPKGLRDALVAGGVEEGTQSSR
ncbi:MAG: helix-turn-helix domain-containing protein [Candidatus Latescibacteria bacterium]|jgi:transcriptional regulator with XRE-family HTH domain|nr:helix-turn-helix domain-containing protein [Candidatus Latescibacterota bacterium]